MGISVDLFSWAIRKHRGDRGMTRLTNPFNVTFRRRSIVFGSSNRLTDSRCGNKHLCSIRKLYSDLNLTGAQLLTSDFYVMLSTSVLIQASHPSLRIVRRPAASSLARSLSYSISHRPTFCIVSQPSLSAQPRQQRHDPSVTAVDAPGHVRRTPAARDCNRPADASPTDTCTLICR